MWIFCALSCCARSAVRPAKSLPCTVSSCLSPKERMLAVASSKSTCMSLWWSLALVAGIVETDGGSMDLAVGVVVDGVILMMP